MTSTVCVLKIILDIRINMIETVVTLMFSQIFQTEFMGSTKTI